MSFEFKMSTENVLLLIVIFTKKICYFLCIFNFYFYPLSYIFLFSIKKGAAQNVKRPSWQLLLSSKVYVLKNLFYLSANTAL